MYEDHPRPGSSDNSKVGMGLCCFVTLGAETKVRGSNSRSGSSLNSYVGVIFRWSVPLSDRVIVVFTKSPSYPLRFEVVVVIDVTPSYSDTRQTVSL